MFISYDNSSDIHNVWHKWSLNISNISAILFQLYSLNIPCLTLLLLVFKEKELNMAQLFNSFIILCKLEMYFVLVWPVWNKFRILLLNLYFLQRYYSIKGITSRSWIYGYKCRNVCSRASYEFLSLYVCFSHYSWERLYLCASILVPQLF